jgi:hypothetical protein
MTLKVVPMAPVEGLTMQEEMVTDPPFTYYVLLTLLHCKPHASNATITLPQTEFHIIKLV